MKKARIGRNDPCPCGSGKKYKDCHLRSTIVTEEQLRAYIETYFHEYSNRFRTLWDEAKAFLPEDRVLPHRIIATISSTHGVAIEYVQPEEALSITTLITPERIETAVFPKTGSHEATRPMFKIGESNGVSMGVSIERLTLQVADGWRFVDIGGFGEVRFRDVCLRSKYRGETCEKIVRCLELYGDNSGVRWNEQRARQDAIDDIIHMLARAAWFGTINVIDAPDTIQKDLLRAFSALRPPDVTLSRLKRIQREFAALIEHGVSESEMQSFLESGRNHLIFGPHYDKAHRQEPLGCEYKVDLFLETTEKEIHLVELEPPSARIYTKKGDPTREFRHAQQQIENYQRWCIDNIAYIRQKHPNIYRPFGYVVIGNSLDLNEKGERQLQQTNVNLRGSIEIIPYDRLLHRLDTMIQNLAALGSGNRI